MTSRAFVAAATAFVLAGSLAGCAPEPTATPTPSGTATVTPTPTATVATAPQPRFDLTCDDIATTATVAAFIDEPIQKQDPLTNYSEQSPELPRLTYIEAMGGLVCDWSNGSTTFSSRSGTTPYAGVSVLILPEADAQYAKVRDYYSITTELRCSAPEPNCEFDKLVNGYWVSVSVQGVVLDKTAPSLVSDFTDSVDTLVTALDAPTPRWTPPVDTIQLGTDCESFISTPEVQTALEAPRDLSVGVPHGGWSMWAGARVESGGGTCFWSMADSDAVEGELAWLPGGAWAAEELLPTTTYPSSVSPATVANLAADDKAFIRCADEDFYCIVDLIIGGNWMQVTTYAGSAPSLGVQDKAIALAGAIAANVNG